MSTPLRRLSKTGVEEFRSYLAQLANDGSLPSPTTLLTSDEMSVEFEEPVELEARIFETRYEAASYVRARLAGLDRSLIDQHSGLWSWLGLYFFDSLCPKGSDGLRKPREADRYALSGDYAPYSYRTGYRHLLYTPFQILSRGASAGMVLLSGKANVHSDLLEQIASRQEFVSNRSILTVIDRLYLDGIEDGVIRVKKGARSKTRPGTLRRLVDLLWQLDATFDLYTLSPDEILRLLPGEFDRWLDGNGTGTEKAGHVRAANSVRQPATGERQD